ncbi:uncharacterized protein V1518DRAFT_419605 [Limtongia smithiae]|uniref:uncharacterized protein n=1 Tax=Limtongia smithiae TaxID=1125753 RepID=UPI0034CD7588
MAGQESWHPSAQDNAHGPPQGLPPPHVRQGFGSQQSGHPVLPPPPSMAPAANRNQGYYSSLPAIPGLSNPSSQHGNFNLPPMPTSAGQPISHPSQSPSMPAQSQLPSLSAPVVQQQQMITGSPPPSANAGSQQPQQQSAPLPSTTATPQQQQQQSAPQHQISQTPQSNIPTPAPLGTPSTMPLAQGIAAAANALSQGQAAAPVSQASYRPLNVKDALSYLDQVKVQFQNQPDVYNRFLDIMKDFKSQSIDTPGVIDRVSTLFSGHPNLIQGFNTFLPPGYRIECSLDPSDPNPIRVTTPMGTTTRPDGQMPIYDQARPWPQDSYAYPADTLAQANTMSQLHAVANGSRQSSAQPEQKRVGGPVEFNHAITYVNKIKNRFATQPDIYKSFLEILQTYQREQRPIGDVYDQVKTLFTDAPDLLDDFKQFLPEAAQQRSVSSPEGGAYAVPATRLPPVGNFAPPNAPKEKKKRNAAAVADSSVATPSLVGASASAAGGPAHGMGGVEMPAQSLGARGASKKVKLNPKPDTHLSSPTLTPMMPEPLPPPAPVRPTADELAFFDRVKKYIGNKQTYNEFLKLLNLFSQDIIDKNVLVEKAEVFIGGNKDLLDWFKRCVDYDGGTLAIENIPYKKHQLELSLCKSYGPSYRLLPKSETHQPCSGRDEMCWEVLNDEWVSHPTWASEDSGFVAHRKNQYEEVLHRIEEERHEYDHNVEGNLRTIQILEPIANRIANMTPEEKVNFKLHPGLGHSSKSIYQRIIKKVYDKERGQEVIDSLHDNPAVAVPIVLKRLKQKDEEWKRAQREWNKVWRETEARVFYKSLDHQGLTFKQADKKTLTTKFLVNEIDTVKKEQFNKRLNPLTPGPRAQLQFSLESSEIVMDMLRLLNCHLEHSNTFSANDREKMDGFIKSFIPLFFGIVLPEPVPDTPSESVNVSETDEESPSTSSTNGSKKSRLPTRDGGDLLRDVLKKVKQGRPKRDKDSESREATPEVSEDGSSRVDGHDNEEIQLPEAVEKAGEIWITNVSHNKDDDNGTSAPHHDGPRVKFNLFANTTIYCFFRLFEILYARLEEVKKLEGEVSGDISSRKPVEFAKELGIISAKIQEMGLEFQPENCYGQLLDMCEKLIDGELEHQWFEESLRQAYRNRAFKMYTVDKVVQAIAKYAHTIISDAKCSEIVLLYDRDRHLAKTTSRDQIIYRLQVEQILGTDENTFRLEWNEQATQLSIQLLSRDDLTLNDAANVEERWKYYLTSYVMSASTEGVPTDRVRIPFLRRNMPAEEPEADDEDEASPSAAVGAAPQNVYTKNGLRVRVCMKTYKLFYKQFTEDTFIRTGLKPYKKLLYKIESIV